MTDNFTERRSKELKERSQSVRNIKSIPRASQNTAAKPEPVPSSRPSKEYNKLDYDFSNQKSSSKNIGEQADYIKNLYKKYLGKENQIQSEKKSRPDPKLKNRDGKSIAKLFQDEPLLRASNTQDHYNYDQQTTDPAKSMARNKSALSVQLTNQKRRQQGRREEEVVRASYAGLLSNPMLLAVGDPRNGIVRCMRNILQSQQRRGN